MPQGLQYRGARPAADGQLFGSHMFYNDHEFADFDLTAPTISKIDGFRGDLR